LKAQLMIALENGGKVMQLPFRDHSEKFAQLFAYVHQAKQDFGSSAAALIVTQNDQIVAEWYDGFHHSKRGARPVKSDSQFNIYSTRKTYVCLAMAVAIVEGNISTTRPVYVFIHDMPSDVLGEITIGDLATATGPKFFGTDRIEREGIQEKVIETITGLTIAELITEKILKPLACTQTEWVTAPKENLVCDYASVDGVATVRIESDTGHERNLYTSTRDLAKWGYLHLKKGYINGIRLLPAAVFDLTETLKRQYRDKRILGWYHHKDWYYATGAAGCHCVVFPAYNAVGVRMLNQYTSKYAEDQMAFNSTLLDCLKKL
jgi:CubicO group peptidase (beta-lactamase class C family)